MIALAHSQNASAQMAALAFSSSQSRSVISNAGWPSYTPHQFELDAELDEDELDREIRGYPVDEESGDDLDIEVGSDDFEVVGVVYDSDEECGEDSQDSDALVDGLTKDLGSSASGNAYTHPTECFTDSVFPQVDSNVEDDSDEEEDSDVEGISNAENDSAVEDDNSDAEGDLDTEGHSDAEGDSDVGYHTDVEDDLDEREQTLGETSGLHAPSTPTSPEVTLIHEDASSKRKREDSEGEETSGDDEDQVCEPPRKTRRTARRGNRSTRTRMTKREADSHRQKGTGAVCGVDGCEVLVSDWKAAKAHLDTYHYAEECAVEASSKNAPAKSVKGKRRVGKANRNGEDKENVSAAKRVRCKYAKCEDSFTSVDNAYRHVKTVHWKLDSSLCTKCGVSFARLDSLRRHVQSNTCKGKAAAG
ncbi:hypothetical protein C8Q70DRAFT_1054595 [Cubamyces menziesii]|uniref:C2H2-type domain-containing protein n=1 Tax=Trametes cubensis TaxID=1111947 RepID=A0AAD7TQ53_9APHY|nr:hypothetical protein C8Q70DRAFT_1054595 [Cubamyces menziesii]KAJ8474092.1 hypothetical protein ONZ51_g7441 [Trametes cubensis]